MNGTYMSSWIYLNAKIHSQPQRLAIVSEWPPNGV